MEGTRKRATVTACQVGVAARLLLCALVASPLVQSSAYGQSAPRSYACEMLRIPTGMHSLHVDPDDFAIIELYRRDIGAMVPRADTGIDDLYQGYLLTSPPVLSDLNSVLCRILIAEKALWYQRHMAAPTEYHIEAVAQLVFYELTTALQSGLRQGDLSGSDKAVVFLQSYLESKEFYVTLRRSNLEKLRHHVAEGNWAYIWN